MTEPIVVVLGDVMLDVITVLSDEPAHGSDTASQISLRPGGSAANVAAWLADDGTRTAYVGRVGDDETGRQAIAALREIGVEPAGRGFISAEGTCVVLVHPDGERTMFPEVGANATVSVPEVDKALADLDAARTCKHPGTPCSVGQGTPLRTHWVWHVAEAHRRRSRAPRRRRASRRTIHVP